MCGVSVSVGERAGVAGSVGGVCRGTLCRGECGEACRGEVVGPGCPGVKCRGERRCEVSQLCVVWLDPGDEGALGGWWWWVRRQLLYSCSSFQWLGLVRQSHRGQATDL